MAQMGSIRHSTCKTLRLLAKTEEEEFAQTASSFAWEAGSSFLCNPLSRLGFLLDPIKLA